MIVGNKNIISYLEKAHAAGSLAQTYIFCGPKSVGKTSAAMWLAEKLLQTPQEKLRISPDFLMLDNDAISKEDADSAIQWLSLSPFGSAKLLIINNAEAMSASAASAFLKTLEEPARKATIILITAEPGKLLPTIISRAAVLKFKTADRDEIFGFVKNSLKAADAKKFVNLSCGRPGRAAQLAANPQIFSETTEGVREFGKLFFGEYHERFAIISKLLAKGEKASDKIAQKIDFWMEIIRDVLLLKYNLNDSLTYIKDAAMIKRLASLKPAGHFAALGAKLAKVKHLLGNNVNYKLMLENLII